MQFLFFPLYGRWEDLDRWTCVVIDVGVILDTSASRSENFLLFDIFRSWVGDQPAIPQGAIRTSTCSFFRNLYFSLSYILTPTPGY